MQAKRWIERALACLIVVTSGACASGGQSSSERQNPNLITRAELEQAPSLDGFEVVRRLRPQWLRVRGPASMRASQEEGVQVYVDGVRRGEVNQLRLMHANQVESMQFLSAREATTRLGTGHSNGAILVAMR